MGEEFKPWRNGQAVSHGRPPASLRAPYPRCDELVGVHP